MTAPASVVYSSIHTENSPVSVLFTFTKPRFHLFVNYFQHYHNKKRTHSISTFGTLQFYVPLQKRNDSFLFTLPGQQMERIFTKAINLDQRKDKSRSVSVYVGKTASFHSNGVFVLHSVPKQRVFFYSTKVHTYKSIKYYNNATLSGNHLFGRCAKYVHSF